MRVLKRGVDKYIKGNIEYNASLLVLFALVFLIAFAVFLLGEPPYSFLALIFLPLTYVLGVYAYRRQVLWGSGVTGEAAVTRALEGLDDSYLLINGVVIPPNRGDTDHIVVGPNGVFVIESKNYGGEIVYEGDSWTRYKVSKKGNRYSIPVGSPSRQVNRNAKVLKDFILEHAGEIFPKRAPHVWVHSLIVFTNPNLSLSMEKPPVDVLAVKDLCEHIKNKKSKTSLSAEEVRRLGETILRCSL